MDERIAVDGFLRELGHRIGATLSLDLDGQCAMTYGDDQELAVSVPPGSGSVILWAPVADCPAAAREAFLERVLKLSLLGIENGGCLLGLEGDGRRIVMAVCQPVGTLDARGFENLLANFIALAGEARASLAQPPDPPSPGEARATAEAAAVWQTLNLRA
jgi:hypothetical protein